MEQQLQDVLSGIEIATEQGQSALRSQGTLSFFLMVTATGVLAALGGMVYMFGYERGIEKSLKYWQLLVPVAAVIVFLFVMLQLTRRRLSTLEDQVESLHERRVQIIQQIKENLPFESAVRLLKRYDPDGKHEVRKVYFCLLIGYACELGDDHRELDFLIAQMMIENPKTQERLSSAENERNELLRLVNDLVGKVARYRDAEETQELLDPLMEQLNRYGRDLPNVRALRGDYADEWLVNTMSGRTPRKTPSARANQPRRTPAAREDNWQPRDGTRKRRLADPSDETEESNATAEPPSPADDAAHEKST